MGWLLRIIDSEEKVLFEFGTPASREEAVANARRIAVKLGIPHLLNSDFE